MDLSRLRTLCMSGVNTDVNPQFQVPTTCPHDASHCAQMHPPPVHGSRIPFSYKIRLLRIDYDQSVLQLSKKRPVVEDNEPFRSGVCATICLPTLATSFFS